MNEILNDVIKEYGSDSQIALKTAKGLIDETNDLQLRKFVSEIQSRIKDDITSDYVLAKLDSVDKEGIIKTVSNAYMCKKLLVQKIIKSHKWTWNHENNKWKKIYYKNIKKNGEITGETKLMMEQAKDVFDRVMIKAHMTSIVNRNVNNNYLMQMLTKWQQIDEEKTDLPNQIADKIEGKKNEI